MSLSQGLSDYSIIEKRSLKGKGWEHEEHCVPANTTTFGCMGANPGQNRTKLC